MIVERRGWVPHVRIGPTGNRMSPHIWTEGGSLQRGGTSRMSREAHVRSGERLWVKLPGADSTGFSPRLHFGADGSTKGRFSLQIAAQPLRIGVDGRLLAASPASTFSIGFGIAWVARCGAFALHIFDGGHPWLSGGV